MISNYMFYVNVNYGQKIKAFFGENNRKKPSEYSRNDYIPRGVRAYLCKN
jgi:hypothetical protein